MILQIKIFFLGIIKGVWKYNSQNFIIFNAVRDHSKSMSLKNRYQHSRIDISKQPPPCHTLSFFVSDTLPSFHTPKVTNSELTISKNLMRANISTRHDFTLICIFHPSNENPTTETVSFTLPLLKISS